jgi:hypothetical protein
LARPTQHNEHKRSFTFIDGTTAWPESTYTDEALSLLAAFERFKRSPAKRHGRRIVGMPVPYIRIHRSICLPGNFPHPIFYPSNGCA